MGLEKVFTGFLGSTASPEVKEEVRGPDWEEALETVRVWEQWAMPRIPKPFQNIFRVQVADLKARFVKAKAHDDSA